MKVTPLGIGGWISNPLLGNVSLFVEVSNARVLIDAGEGTYRALRMCGYDVNDIDLILISHKHGDHLMGLTTLALYAKALGKALKVYGPNDIDLGKLFEALGIPQYLEAIEFNPIEPSPEPQVITTNDNFKISAVAADHTVSTLAYRIDDSNGTCITYSSDTRPTNNIINLAKNCTLLIHEASGNPGTEEASHQHGHSTTNEAVDIARKAGVKYLMPIHYYIESPIITNNIDVSLILPIQCTTINLEKLKQS
ncbi:MAG: MBL fold metallo-hydrolase [Vulcanisaeta sp. AZ3]